MSKNELERNVKDLRELRRMADELGAEISALEDSIKAYMNDLNTDTLRGTGFLITWKNVTSSRLDSKALKAEVPELWQRFSKQTTTRRFVLAG